MELQKIFKKYLTSFKTSNKQNYSIGKETLDMSKSKVKENKKVTFNQMYQEEVERRLKRKAEVEQELITESNYLDKLEYQLQAEKIRRIEAETLWENDFKPAYNRLIEKLNPDGQNNMRIFTVFWELDCHCKVTMEQLFQQLENWGYVKTIETEDGTGTEIYEMPYTGICFTPHIDIEGYMCVQGTFVISEEVAKKLKEYFSID